LEQPFDRQLAGCFRVLGSWRQGRGQADGLLLMGWGAGRHWGLAHKLENKH